MPTEIGVLNRVTVPDAYSQTATLIATQTKRLTIFVYNNSLLYQLALDQAGNKWDLNESELPPGFHSLARVCSGIRFRNFIAGQAAVVSVKMLR